MRRNRIGAVLGSAVLATVLCAGVLAQQPGAPGGGRGGQGRGGGQGGFGQGRGFGRGGQPTVVNVPVAALEKPLSLNADQVKKIGDIQTKHREGMRTMFPRGGPGGGRRGGGAPGQPGQPGGAPPGQPGGGAQDIQAMMAKMTAANDKAAKDIDAILTSSQKAKLPAVLKEMQAARGAQIPVEIVGDLKLTADQVKKLEAISAESQTKMREMFSGGARGAPGQPGQPGGGDRQQMFQKFQEMRQATHQKTLGVLTPAQQAILKKYEDAHPRPQRGAGGAIRSRN